MTAKTTDTYTAEFALGDISNVVSTINQVTKTINPDLLSAALIMYLLWLSDRTIVKDLDRLQNNMLSMSNHLNWITTMPQTLDPKKAN